VPCGTCLYIRLPDRNQTAGKLRTYLSSAEFKQLAREHAYALVTTPVATFELVSACKPAAICNNIVRQGLLSACNNMKARARGRNVTRNSCNEVVRQRLESLSTSGDETSRIAKLRDHLMISAKNAEIVYDQLRCARCDRVHQLQSVSSSFYHAISRLHHQLTGRESTNDWRTKIFRDGSK